MTITYNNISTATLNVSGEFCRQFREILVDFSLDFDDFMLFLSETYSSLAAFGNATDPILTILEDVCHLFFLGERLYADVRVVSDSWTRKKVVLEYVYKRDNKFKKSVAHFAPYFLAKDDDATFEYSGFISIKIFHNEIRILNTSPPYFVSSPLLSYDRLVEFFQREDSIRRQLKKSYSKRGFASEHLASVEVDREKIRTAYIRVLERKDAEIKITEASHAYVGAILHVLPRLILSPPGESILDFLKASLVEIAHSGFKCVMLGVVDKQSTDVYYGEDEHGVLTSFFNNHGYWSPGEVGIDPLIGTLDNYIDFVETAHLCGLTVIQDTVLGSLGYPPQLPEFGEFPRLSLESGSVGITDTDMFLHEACIAEEDGLVKNVSPEWYAEVLSQSHRGAPFALPKPNLFRQDILSAAFSRPLHQIQMAGVTAFRIDMAKHIGLPQLRDIIVRLNQAVAYRTKTIRSASCIVLLEYWTTLYRDLKVAITALGTANDNVYFFDYPLAQAIQNILIRNLDVFDSVRYVLDSRIEWGIDVRQLIPVFIDHDFSFKPIYNGSLASSSATIFGFALCLMLSSNGPYIYFGFDKAEQGVPNVKDFDQYSEAFARKMVHNIFSVEDKNSPFYAISDILEIAKDFNLANHLDVDISVVRGSSDDIVIRKSGMGKESLEAHFSRSEFEPSLGSSASTLFFHAGPPGVLIRKLVV